MFAIKLDRNTLTCPSDAYPVAMPSEPHLASLAHRTNPSQVSEVRIHPLGVKQLAFPFRAIRSARGTEFWVCEQRRFAMTATRPRGTFCIQFLPICIHLGLQLQGILKGRALQRPLSEGAMAAFHTAVAFWRMPRNQAMFDPQSGPPQTEHGREGARISLHKDVRVVGLNRIRQTPLRKRNPTIVSHLRNAQ